ncbi:hypothetical protein C8J57DRAFT_1525443 [Mycena rebaudengoi]|nr:hypothetical protein C8J57DRAFT_1525443 [Mycena rebaudengoi]
MSSPGDCSPTVTPQVTLSLRTPRSPPPLRTRIHSLAASFNSRFEEFGPPTDDDTPHTRGAWRYLLDSIESAGMFIATRLPGRAMPVEGAHAEEEQQEEDTPIDRDEEEDSNKGGDNDRDAEDNSDDDDADADTEPAAQSKKEKAHIIATKLDIITLPVSLTAIKDEDRALHMIFRGFTPPTRSWNLVIKRNIDHTPSNHPEFCKTVLAAGPKLFVSTLTQQIVHSTNSSAIEAYLDNLLIKIETIKFATKWNRGGPGSLLYKKEFNTVLYQETHPRIFRGLSTKDKAKMMRKHADDFGAFKTAHNPLITGRNHLQQAWTKFGIAVLRNPLWQVENLGQKCAKQFRDIVNALDVLNCLEDRLNEDGYTRLDLLEDENLEVLLGIMKVLCTDDAERKTVVKFIEAFLDKYPSSIQSAQ